jgi:hypothetical protein
MKKTDAVATRCATGPWSCSASHSAGAVQSSRRVDLEHIEWRPDGLLINIPYSKTNESGEPEVIGVPKFVGDPLCPVAALANAALDGREERCDVRGVRRSPGHDRAVAASRLHEPYRRP